MFNLATVSPSPLPSPGSTLRSTAVLRSRQHGAVSLSMTLLALAGMVVLASPALGQETRDEAVATEQAGKATRVQAYQPTGLERKLETIDGLLFGRRNLYAFIGSTFPGGGLALGPGYRTRFADTGRLDTHAAWSVKNDKAADAALALPKFADGRLTVSLHASWLDTPDVAFYGTGMNSVKNDRTGYAYTTTTAGVSGRVQVARHFAVGGGVDAIATEASFLDDSYVASALGRTLALGRTVDPSYRRTNVFAEFDSRTSPGYTRSGALYRVDWADHRQANGSSRSFQRFDAEVRQFVPLMRENWVLALRALASTTSTAADQEVPYLLLPDLGGSHTLRGYSAWRFRDRSRLLMSAEYRWMAGPFVDMSLFLDAGTAAARMRDFDAQDFKKSYGIGMSMHTPSSTVTRIELARTSEGLSLGLSFSPSF